MCVLENTECESLHASMLRREPAQQLPHSNFYACATHISRAKRVAATHTASDEKTYLSGHDGCAAGARLSFGPPAVLGEALTGLHTRLWATCDVVHLRTAAGLTRACAARQIFINEALKLACSSYAATRVFGMSVMI